MKITALAGGVGGAKLAQGLSEIMPVDDLSIVVNTGDDLELYGLYICPDLDTVSYTLAGMANPVTGWGIKDETFNTFQMLQENSSPAWFQLGDKDLATHMERTRLLKEGKTLTEVMLHFRDIWQIKHPILPMTNDKVPTYVGTNEKGVISFQEYFVKYHFEPTITDILFFNIEKAKPTEEVMAALDACDAVVICPSNPFVSVDPILSLKRVRDILKEKYVVAVSPIIGGKAVKGPLKKMYDERGVEPTPAAIALHYKDFLDCIYLDNKDEGYGKIIKQSGIIFQVTNIMMPDLENRIRLAEEIYQYIKKRID